MQQSLPSAWSFHLATSYVGETPQQPAVDEAPADTVVLPAPHVPETLAALLNGRASCRRFGLRPLTSHDLATLLQAAYGLTGTATVNGTTFTTRPVPSAGARYPLSLYVMARDVEGVASGVYRWVPDSGDLRAIGSRPPDNVMATVFLDQPYVATAAAIVVIVAEPALTLQRYADRGYRYVLFEAGHVAQNLALCAAATGVGNLQIGGFLDRDLGTFLDLDDHTAVPLYAAALAYPDGDDPDAFRAPPVE